MTKYAGWKEQKYGRNKTTCCIDLWKRITGLVSGNTVIAQSSQSNT